MRKLYILMAAGVSCLAVSTANAQDAESPTTTGEQPDTTGISDAGGDIIVTARRRDESLQEVPATVTVVSGETVQKLNLLKFEDVEVLSPGLELEKGTGGFTAVASIRGLSFSNASGGQAPVDTYINDVPVDQNYAFNSIYDVGQIEVLRGPQGTLRGRPAPSGAITLTTKRPDLDEIGGYMSFLASDRDAIMGQGAVNVPVVPGVLAVRFAAVVDQSEGTGIRSVNTGRKPVNEVKSFRVTTLLQPTENLEFLFTYQQMKANSLNYPQVFGTGFVPARSAAGAIIPGQPPANYNGPVLTSADRRAVAERPDGLSQDQRFISWQGRLQLPGIDSELIYIGANQRQRTVASNVNDNGNSIINFAPFQVLRIPQDIDTHELRLQSVGENFLDYVVGLWSSEGDSATTIAQSVELAGAFGVPGSFSGPFVDPRYQIFVTGDFAARGDTKAIFGNVAANITDRLEVSAGARYSVNKSSSLNALGTSAAFVAVNLPFPCFFAGATPSPFPGGFCDFAIPASPANFTPNVTKTKPWTYQGSVKYEFSDNLMAYASYGRSFRPGSINLTLENPDNNPILRSLFRSEDEKSTLYEVGVKGSTLDGRLQFAVAAFQQDFPNLLISADTARLGNIGGSGRREVDAGTINTNAKARIRGFEAEASFRITPNWSFGVTAAYAKGKVRNDLIACRDGNGDGIADDTPIAVIQTLSNQAADNPGSPPPRGALTAANPVAFCARNDSTGDLPNWSATAQSEISLPFSDDDEFYLRGLFSYKPRNKNAFGTYVVPPNANLNLYAGVRLDDRIDIGVFSKNVFDQDDETSRSADPITGSAGLGPTGYFATSRTLPREIGVTVRASFGSR